MNDKVKTTIKFIIALTLIVISGYYSVKDTDPEDLMNALTGANYLWVLLCVPIILFSHYLRAVRWKIMLKPIIRVKSNYNLFKAVMIGYAANAVTPRGGELLRPYVYARREGVSFSSTFATIIVERFLDLLTLLVLFVVALFVFQDMILHALNIIFEKLNVNVEPQNFLFVVLIVVTVMIISFFPPVIRFLLRIFIRSFSVKFYDKIISIFEKFRQGFAIIKDPTEYLRIAFYSILIWICYGIPNYLIFFAFGFDLGADDAFFLLIINGVAVTLAPTPGSIGVLHVAIRLALVIIYGMSEQDAVAYAIVNHGISYLISTLVGGYYYVRHKPEKPVSEALLDENQDLNPDKS